MKAIIVAAFAVSALWGRGYYFNSAGANGSGTAASPWNALASLSSATLAPGDTAYFARGSSFTGSQVIGQSGTAQDPIVLTAYGTGAPPRFQSGSATTNAGNAFLLKGKYIVIDGFAFHDCAIPTTGDCYQIVYQMGAVHIAEGADYCIVRNCEVSNCPLGIQIKGQHCLVTKNNLHDMNGFMCGGSWGPIGIFIGNAYNEISWNRITNYKVVGGSFGADGGALELDDGGATPSKVHHISIHHNTTKVNEGFAEVTTAGDSVNVFYNLSYDYQWFMYFDNGSNSLIANNTVICTLPNNTGEPGTGVNGGSRMKYVNNIFVVANKIAVCGGSGSDACAVPSVHTNNLFYSADKSNGEPSGWPLGGNEFVADPQFTKFTLNDTDLNDFHLAPTSPAIGKGVALGIAATDLDGAALPAGAPDLGAYQHKLTTAAAPPHRPSPAEPPAQVKGGQRSYDLTGRGFEASPANVRRIGAPVRFGAPDPGQSTSK